MWIVLELVGCGTTISTARIRDVVQADRCARVPLSGGTGRAERTASTAPPDVPPELLRIARAAELEAALEPGWLDSLDNRQRFLERVLLLQAELRGVAGELGCLDDELEVLQQELAERERAAEWGFTLSSIVVGALAGVAAGIADIIAPDAPIAAGIGIGGGLGSAILGGLALFPPGHSVELAHERNVLRLSTTVLPPFVVRLLNAPRDEGSAALEGRWRRILENLSGNPPEHRRLSALFFGDGGTYDLAALRARETMLEELEIEVDLQTQELELLIRILDPRRTRPSPQAIEQPSP